MLEVKEVVIILRTLVLAKVDLEEVEEDLNLVIDLIQSLMVQLKNKVDGVIMLELLKKIPTRIVVGERSSIF